jgi:hypothetical protein
VTGDDGRPICFSVQLQDVTERRAQEDELRRDADAARRIDEVRAALAEDRVALLAQPIVDLASGRTVGHELLARIVRADGSRVFPGDFMPAVERFGLSVEFDAHVIRRAVALACAGRALSVNLSARSVGSARLIATLRDALADAGADPALLTFEITETALSERRRRMVTPSCAPPGRRPTHLGGSQAATRDLARVEEVLRVERRLERTHELEHHRAVLELEELRLAVAHAVLAAARAAERDRAPHEPLVEGDGARDLGLVVGVEQH